MSFPLRILYIQAILIIFTLTHLSDSPQMHPIPYNLFLALCPLSFFKKNNPLSPVYAAQIFTGVGAVYRSVVNPRGTTPLTKTNVPSLETTNCQQPLSSGS